MTKITDHDRVMWKLIVNLFHKLDKMLRVAVGNIETNILHLRH